MRRRQHVHVVPSSSNRAFRPPHATYVTLSHDCCINAYRCFSRLNFERTFDLLLHFEDHALLPFFTARPSYEGSVRRRQSWPFSNVRRISPHPVPSNPTTQRFLCAVLLVGLVATAAFWTATEAYEEGQSTRSWVPRYVEGETPKCRPPFSGRWLVTHPGAAGAPAYHVDMFAVNKGIYNGVWTHSTPHLLMLTLPYRRFW